MANKTNRRRVSLFLFILTMIFFYAPLVLLVVYSFNSSKTMTWEGFSFKWYEQLFFNSDSLWRSFFNSIIIALTSATVSTVIGTLGAIGIYRYKFKFKKYTEVVSYLPLILPEIIIGVALLIFFNKIHLKLGLASIIIAHITFNIPYVLFIVMARLSEFDNSVLEAAYDLGATELDTLRKVIIPMAKPGIISAFLIAITLSLDDFVITFFVAGPGSSTLPLHVYSMIRFGVTPVINALSVVLILASIILAVSSKKMFKYMFAK